MKPAVLPVRQRGAWTLVELLVVIAIVALLIGMLLPSLAGSREAARGVKCASNERQLVIAWSMYAGEFKDVAMPLAYWEVADIGSGEQVFWWGNHGTTTTPPDFTQGFLYPFLGSSLHPGSVFECPSQAWGTYRPQGPSRSPTSTYGYNGYYLSPAKTPGWGSGIGHRPWQKASSIHRPQTLMVFADALLPSMGSGIPGNTALLDPPMLYTGGSANGSGGTWSPNPSPTTAFRHGRAARSASLGSVNATHADGHVSTTRAEEAWLRQRAQGIGSVEGEAGMAAHYVPDWDSWARP